MFMIDFKSVKHRCWSYATAKQVDPNDPYVDNEIAIDHVTNNEFDMGEDIEMDDATQVNEIEVDCEIDCNDDCDYGE